MSKKAIYFLVGLLIIIVGVSFYAAQNDHFNDEPSLAPGTTISTPEASLTPVSETSPTPAEVTPTPVRENWQIYQSSQHNFSIQHPEAMEVEMREMGRLVFMLTGPTQEPNTELFDGISLAFNSGERELEFREFVEQRHQEDSQEPVTEDITEISAASVNDINGYEYTLTGPFGDIQYIYLPAGTDGYLQITQSVYDPTNQGFEEIVETMLMTLEIE